MSRWPAALSRHRRAVAVAAVVIAIGVVTFLTIRAGSNNDDLVPATEASTTLPPSGAQAELLRLLEAGRQANYTASYRQSGPTGESQVRQARRPPQERMDTTSGSGDQTKREVDITLPSGRVGCTQQGTEPWSCEKKAGGTGGSLTNIMTSTIVGQLRGYNTEARDERVATEPSRCFTLSGGEGGPAEICFTTDGILSRVVAGDVRLELTDLDRRAPGDDVFVLPAPVSG